MALSHTVTDADYERWKKDLSNWGRWGKDDQIGALNLITPAKRKQAAALVKEGVAVSLAADPDTIKAVDNPNPYEVTMQGIGADRIAVNYHGIAHTHLDSLAHINDNGRVLQRLHAESRRRSPPSGTRRTPFTTSRTASSRAVFSSTSRGSRACRIWSRARRSTWKTWRRGKSKPGVKVTSGDALFVRTGVWARRKALGPWLRGRAEGGRSAGLDPSVIPWLKQRDIALLASDHPQYVAPSNRRGAVHDFALLYLGVHLIDNCDLEALSEASAARRRWEFLLTAAPLPIPGGTGSPINPIATF